jgi:Xaa-Pro aminopeptidase
VQRRLDRLRERLDAAGLDALLVGNRPNIRYLSEFSGSSAALLVSAKEAVLFTDSRYTVQAEEEVSEVDVKTIQDPPLRAALQGVSGGDRIGFEAEHVSVAEHDALAEKLGGRRLVPTCGIVEEMRAVKEPQEIDAIAASVALNSRAFEKGLETVRPGVAEVEVAAVIEHEMRSGGASAPAFESIVASGPRGALPHALASRRPLASGEPVIVDIGTVLNGYASDMTRTLFLDGPGDRGRRVHDAVLEALKRAEGMVRAGQKASAVDGAARDALAEAGFAKESFEHGTGHGVGLEVHEAPRIGRRRDEPLVAGMVFTIEPGVYVPGWGGVRIEDIVVVEENGCRILTPTPKELLAV